MGWKSTVELTRQQCIDRIEQALSGATDIELEDALEMLVGNRDGFNFLICPDDDEDESHT